ncbi:hypothetical protein SASPL_125876 [Salvia splendens]|uniref:Uncharacterized protein n=1 Tax=Salvia splendens TaxID=180675 RepID=A0A8X8ZQ92_SALSN|nr:hypothetical protein SASPL_125876 [Salvia splendens]
MALEVEIISDEMIKLSSPTPTHLRILKLSLLDQIAPPIYVPLIFFYNHHQLELQNLSRHRILALLKQSLSNILTDFYPLAGRIQDNSSINCNDLGAEFVEARVHTSLSEIIQNPNMEELKKLQISSGEDEKVMLRVKIPSLYVSHTRNSRNSVAICISHKIADGMSLVAFANALAAASRREIPKFKPSFDFASVFPPRDLSGLESTQRTLRKQKRAPERRRLLLHMFGNCWRPAIAMSGAEGSEAELVGKLRGSVDMFIKGGVEFSNFSSWCRFPVYEVDFGWGKPVWVCTTTLPFKNLVILMSTPCGEGIEAWVNIVEEDLKMFEQSQQLVIH